MTAFGIIFNFLFWITLGVILSAKKKGNRPRTVSSDGHVVPKEEDLTCNNLSGHNHNPVADRYIVHNKPDNGYVVLNGEMRRIEDCKDL